jgi:hypothetical protein
MGGTRSLIGLMGACFIKGQLRSAWASVVIGTVLRCVVSWLGVAGIVVDGAGAVGVAGCAWVVESCVMGAGVLGVVVCAYTRPAPTTVSAATVVVRSLEVFMMGSFESCTGQGGDNSRKKRLSPD